MKKSILTIGLMILFAPLVSYGQNPTGIQFLPGSCQTTINKTISLYRMPDTTNAYRTDVTDAYGIYDFSLIHPGVYWRKLTVGTTTFWADKSSYTPVVGIGGDSTSNAGRIIQNAEDSLPSSGGILKLPPGVHLIDSLTMTFNTDNITIEGTGANCILKSANSLNAYQITVANGTENFTIRNLVMFGNKANQTAGGGINVNGSTIRRVTIENVTFRHFYDNAVVFANGVSDIRVRGNFFDSIGTAGQTSVTAAFPLYFVTSISNAQITGNTFTWWSGTAAVRVNNNCQKFQIHNNIFRGNDRTGTADRRAIFADSGVTGANTEISVIGNQIFDIDENGVFMNGCNRSTIANNSVDSVGNNGFELNGAQLVIANNYAKRCQKDGIATNQSKTGTISGNVCEQNYGRGIYVFTGTGDSTVGITITGNTCFNNSQSPTNTQAGIEVGESGTGVCRRITIIGNACFDTQGSKTQKYGIVTTGDVDYYTIVGNALTPNATGSLSDAASPAANKYVPAGGNP